ncbi:MAG: GspE/PulE family protein [Candidatus Omnitrophica bacterium]|jgi:type IV pilus assembly protein PilB|nr:GspE/PulE family protein [Candidatus Omnitrophota bacterium]MDD5079286.1 GspE/PulE family protein [Candidatus Omnitrophota bacterium]
MIDAELEKILADAGALPREKLDRAVDESGKLHRPLEKVILDLKLMDRPVLYGMIAKHTGSKYMSLADFKKNAALAKVVPESLAQQTRSVPVKVEDNVLHVAMVEAVDLLSIDQLQMQTGMTIEAYLSSPDEIEEARSRLYSEEAAGQDLISGMAKPATEAEAGSKTDGPSIIKLVDLIVSQAVHDRASDIHIEPEQELTRIRFRIDGILHEIPSPPKEWEPAIISRIKVLSGMDIAESRVPQDGHFQAKIEDKNIDLRVSTMPTLHGENVVMRLLDTASVRIGLEKMGFSTTEQLKRYEGLIARPYGIILSTGPTGSGKTTTLYSALMRINTIDRNIITIEDPVEYRLGLIRQVQVNPKAGITFANGLRAMLRQDPDVIMVGEIRDLETAIIAIQAALTGHLVFSTLHTNDAASAVTRLVNMGVESFLISASLIGVMAQRLVRVICENCKEEYTPSRALADKWGISLKTNPVLYRGRGCDHCKGTGFRGRTGIFELMVIDDELREMVISGASTINLRKKAQEKGMQLLSQDGMLKVVSGITTIEEIARVCEEHVDLKPAAAEEVDIKPLIAAAKPAAKQVQVKESDIAAYQNKIASWLEKRT